MRDILTEASPFDINSEGEILYSRVFKNPEKLRPQFVHLENPDRMSQLMNYGATEQSFNSTLRVILESESWRFISTKARIGLYNRSVQPREYKVKFTEIKEKDMLTEIMQAKFMLFDSIFKKEDAAQVS